MSNEKNLKIPSSEEAREIGRLGGIKSGEARRKKKALKSTLLTLLNENYEQEGEVKDGYELITLALLKKAGNGSVEAFNSIRDLIGEKPVEKQEVDTTLKVTMSEEIKDLGE